MILNRIALFFAFVFGFASTQAPEFWQQYQQRLGGAIDELTTIVSQFDSEAAAQHLSESRAVDRLEANSDPLAQGRGAEMQRIVNGWRGSAGAQPRSTRRTSSRNGSRSPRPSTRPSRSAPMRLTNPLCRQLRTDSFPASSASSSAGF
ncbi:MAG: DUF2937 family protein [Methylovirgula sp.]